MPRPGAGGSSSGGRPVSGNSSSRSVSGHRVGQSTSRPGAGTGMGASSRGPQSAPPRDRGFNSPPPQHRGYNSPPPPPHGYHNPPPPPPPRRRTVVNTTTTTASGGSSSAGGVLVGILIFVAVILLFAFFGMSCSGNSGSSGSNVTNRTKLSTGNSYDSNCIVDELNWFDNVGSAESNLKYFFSKTGVQPYIVLHKYDAALASDSQKDAWASSYYEQYISREDVFLYVYFEEENPNDVGYMSAVSGQQVDSVMDGAAKKVFWNNIDKYWTSNLSTDDVFVNAFKDTADTIMKKQTNRNDVLKWILIVIAIILVILAVIKIIKMKQQRAKEKAEEDQRILDTPLSEMTDSAADKLADKYLSDDEK